MGDSNGSNTAWDTQDGLAGSTESQRMANPASFGKPETTHSDSAATLVQPSTNHAQEKAGRPEKSRKSTPKVLRWRVQQNQHLRLA